VETDKKTINCSSRTGLLTSLITINIDKQGTLRIERVTDLPTTMDNSTQPNFQQIIDRVQFLTHTMLAV